METTGNTVLITGGSAGIGWEIAKAFKARGNQVILVGRDEDRLRRASERLGGAPAIRADVSDAADADRLVRQVEKEYPGLNVLVNNAGLAFAYALSGRSGAFEKAGEEMLTNYLSVIRLTERLLPAFAKKERAAVVNVSSIVAFAPNHKVPTYAASKAALHSYSRSLRLTLERETAVKVFELMPPLVDTDFSAAIGGAAGMPASAVAEALLEGMAGDRYEIRVGRTEQLYRLYLNSPEEALLAMNPVQAA